MQCHHIFRRTVSLIIAMVCLISVLPTGSALADEAEILKITQGKPVKLGPYGYVNSQTLGVSRTGVIAAGVGSGGWPGMHAQWITYRVSKDGGKTWTEHMQGFGPVRSGVEAWVSLRGGGVLQVEGFQGPTAVESRPGWWDTILTRFSDDMMHYEMETIQVYMPQATTRLSEPSPLYMSGPHFGTGMIIQLPNGDLLSPMQGKFKGDTVGRVFLTRSVDRGRTWRYHGTMSYEPKDPNPELPGQYIGAAESSIALLPNGQLLCMMRTQYSHLPNEYRPLYVCWSDDLGKTWTKPVPTKPQLMNIWPTLQVLDNGVLACIYGRPGFHVAFSTDNGHTWKDRVSFSDLAEPDITGQVDGIRVGPNKLLAIGGVGPGGTQVFPITVERVKVSRGRVALPGRVLDQQGQPIAGARVQRSPNRYTADFYIESTELEKKWNVPKLIGSPKLGYRSIRKADGYPTVQTDSEGRFRFDSVELGEYILTVEANDYAPQHQHIKLAPEAEAQEFRLKPGRKICNRVMDNTGRPVPGACVVLNRWHVHSDSRGFFHWSVEALLPEQVEIRVYKRYSDQYEPRNWQAQLTQKTTVPFSQIEREPIILRRKG